MALITAAQARLNIPTLTSTGSDTDLDTVIGRVGVAIARYLGYPALNATTPPTVESTTYTWYSGGYEAPVTVSADGESLFLPAKPVTSVTSVHDDPDQGYGSSYLVASGGYTTNLMDGIIRLLPTGTHGQFSKIPYAVKVIAVCGWTTIPTDLQAAAILCVQHWWTQKREGLHSSLSAQGVSLSPQQVAIPKEAKELLAPFRISRWVA